MVQSVRATTNTVFDARSSQASCRGAVPTSASIPPSSSEERLPLLERFALGIDKPEDQERARVAKHRPSDEADIPGLVAVAQELLSDRREASALAAPLVIAQPSIEGT